MKRSAITRRTPIARGKGFAPTGASLRRSRRMPAANRKRKAERYARDFGDEVDRVRAMPCLITGTVPSEPAHVTSRGAGGGRFDIVPLCSAMHRQQHSVGIESFQGCHKLDLRGEADRIAAEHPEPLGIRGLARRWADDSATVTGYDLDALFGWVRRRADRVEHVGEQGPLVAKLEAISTDLGLHLADADKLANAAGVEGWLSIEDAGALARRWVDERDLARVAASGAKIVDYGTHEPLDDYEREALFGWVRRRIECIIEGPPGRTTFCGDVLRGAIADAVADDLGISDGVGLCDAAEQSS